MSARYVALAVALMLVIVPGAYAWQAFHPAQQGDVSSIGVHTVMMVLAVLLGIAYRSDALWLPLSLQIGYSAQYAGCSLAYLIAPWPVGPGAEQCSARLGIPLGLMGLVAALLILSHLTRRRHGHLHS